MARLTRWLFLLAAPLLLTSCLLVPAKFASTLDIRANRSFTFTYVGEVQFLKPDGPGMGPDGDGGDRGWDEPAEDSEVRLIEIAQDTGAGATDGDFGDTAQEAAELRRLAQALSLEHGYRSVRYVGDRKLAIDYRISGRLDHAFVFPFHPDAEIVLPFLAIELRGRDRLRVKAPGFANDASSSPMGGMGGMGTTGGESPGAALDGTFTLTTDAEIVSQNQEDGAQPLPGGGRTIMWTADPGTRDAPMAVLRVNALP